MQNTENDAQKALNLCMKYALLSADVRRLTQEIVGHTAECCA